MLKLYVVQDKKAFGGETDAIAILAKSRGEAEKVFKDRYMLEYNRRRDLEVREADTSRQGVVLVSLTCC
jgi:hypothetical protein